MQVMQNVARRYGLVCLLHEKPFAGVNGSGKHNNWSMGTDTGPQPARAGRHAAREHLVPVLLRGGDRGRQPATRRCCARRSRTSARTTASARTRRRRRSSRSSSAPSCARSSRRSRRGEGDPATPGSFLGLGTPVLPPLPMHGGDRNRTSPFAFTGNKFEFRALGSSMSLALPEHRAEHDRRRGDRRALRQARGRAGRTARRSTRPSSTIVRETYTANKQIVLRRRQLLRGVARGGRAARADEPAHDARRAAVARREADDQRRSSATRCCPSASSSRASRCSSSSTRRSSTSRPRRRRRSPGR